MVSFTTRLSRWHFSFSPLPSSIEEEKGQERGKRTQEEEEEEEGSITQKFQSIEHSSGAADHSSAVAAEEAMTALFN